jgi:hypothetical protein
MTDPSELAPSGFRGALRVRKMWVKEVVGRTAK